MPQGIFGQLMFWAPTYEELIMSTVIIIFLCRSFLTNTKVVYAQKNAKNQSIIIGKE